MVKFVRSLPTVATSSKVVQPLPAQRSRLKPVSFVALSCQLKLIRLADTATATRLLGALIADDGVFVGVTVGVAVGGNDVFVGVAVGGNDVFVGVAVGGNDVFVGVAVGVAVGVTFWSSSRKSE